jgi:hypothetical protein
MTFLEVAKRITALIRSGPTEFPLAGYEVIFSVTASNKHHLQLA